MDETFALVPPQKPPMTLAEALRGVGGQAAPWLDPQAAMAMGAPAAQVDPDSLGQVRASNLGPMLSDNALKSALTGYNPDSPPLANRMAGYSGMGSMAGMPAVGMIKAYHGSPYDFDAFDMSKIGTGEGAQAYGHGLYFAENPGVAETYQRDLSRRNTDVNYGGAQLKSSGDWAAMIDNLNRRDWREAKLLDQYGKTGGPLPDYIRQQRDWYRDDKGMQSALDRFEQKAQADWTPGKTYEVGIDAHPDEFLDWDKPLSEQSDVVKQKLNDAWLAHPIDHAKQTGEDIYRNNTPGFVSSGPYKEPDHAAAAAVLRDAGIKGIRYLDQGSRSQVTAADLESAQAHVDIENRRLQFGKDGAAQALRIAQDRLADLKSRYGKPGTSNYVVFDDKTISILKKYGLAGLTAGAGALAASAGAPPQSQQGRTY